MATFTAFFNNITITHQERELLTELMGEREIHPDDTIDLLKEAPTKRSMPSSPHQHPSSGMTNPTPTHVPSCWTFEDFGSLTQSFRIVATDIPQPDLKGIMVSSKENEEPADRQRKK
ncbi:hypothetical protein RIB2604_00800080 [Aspergillus luchuensis]|uniref:Uncharacterized protein n=1 Tax=Aspergillus kawachii TaxID=1069201 RepID=A0A146F322_ASPKA|nr:hypothetical protein AKAW_11281 [Aspergillus luchuensis IFO 4308]GAT20540.1 hypothetical protein RIB2604_00800080 [Aspergillus luchuensis]